MVQVIAQLCGIIGIDLTPPQTMAEVLPWMLQAVIGLALIWFFFSMVRMFVSQFGKGRWL
jgi:hypothetical protein